MRASNKQYSLNLTRNDQLWSSDKLVFDASERSRFDSSRRDQYRYAVGRFTFEVVITAHHCPSTVAYKSKRRSDGCTWFLDYLPFSDFEGRGYSIGRYSRIRRPQSWQILILRSCPSLSKSWPTSRNRSC